MTGYFKFFTGPHGSAGRAAVIVKITASDGSAGWGQSLPIAKWSYETLETAAVVLKDYFAPGPHRSRSHRHQRRTHDDG